MNAQHALVFDPATGSYYQVPHYGMAQQYPYGYCPIQMGHYQMAPVFVQAVQPMYHQSTYYPLAYNGSCDDPSSVHNTYEESYEPLHEDNLPVDFSFLNEDVDIVAKAVPVDKKTVDLYPSAKVEILSIKEEPFTPVKGQKGTTRVKPVIQVLSLKKSDSEKNKFVKKNPNVVKNNLLNDRKDFIDLLVSIATSHSDDINRSAINISKRMREEDFEKYYKFFFRTEKDYSFWERYKTTHPLDEVEKSIPFWIAVTSKYPIQACFHVKGLKL